jgi:hypothetical protein
LLRTTTEPDTPHSATGPRTLVVLAAEVRPGSLEPIPAPAWQSFEGFNARREPRAALGVGVSMLDPEQPASLRAMLTEAGQPLPAALAGATAR